jgi:small subunit ribosomal protein S14
MERKNLKDAKRRISFNKVEQKRLLYKAMIQDRNLSPDLRFDICSKLTNLSRSAARCKINNRCILTGRSKSVLRKFKISRICVRELVAFGALPGVMKSSW